jgi:hypothetical protein
MVQTLINEVAKQQLQNTEKEGNKANRAGIQPKFMFWGHDLWMHILCEI